MMRAVVISNISHGVGGMRVRVCVCVCVCVFKFLKAALESLTVSSFLLNTLRPISLAKKGQVQPETILLSPN